uniref:Resistance to inhibitors of cholinesterase protein 3 N-terminal domain-containing protein n=1 Tax=Stomoxys calcitrans TaxID=35570 RepID=A0A1I8PV52_STOCA|nr:unnamed protein product [Stomoxys calcitrans]
MHARKEQQQPQQRKASHPIYLNEGLSPKKTALIIVTVVGCIAILWPKVFYPMMFGGNGVATNKGNMKEPHRGPGGCCDVVLNKEEFFNITTLEPEKPPSEARIIYGPQLYRKSVNIYTGEISLRQERPAHLHPDSVYQAMRERGRAIPATPTIPIVERKSSPSNPPPRIVEGRPGPIPGMRPPMGAGAMHQPQAKGNQSMGILMPLYTIGIVIFFGYTIIKIVFKKPVPNAPYGPAPADPNFRKEVFGHENGRHVEDLNGSKLGWREHQTIVTAIQGLIDAADEELKLRETSTTTTDPTKKNSNENSTTNISNGHANTIHETSGDDNRVEEIEVSKKEATADDKHKVRDGSADRTVAVLGMEVSASCEGGQKWLGRPPTPVLPHHHEHSKLDDDIPEPQSIYLEGTLAHDSQILVADAETKQEEVQDDELDGSCEEPAIVISSKMTLSLINLDSLKAAKSEAKKANATAEIESPLADDIEIIGHDFN